MPTRLLAETASAGHPRSLTRTVTWSSNEVAPGSLLVARPIDELWAQLTTARPVVVIAAAG